mgnify:CR=1 FL=1
MTFRRGRGPGKPPGRAEIRGLGKPPERARGPGRPPRRAGARGPGRPGETFSRTGSLRAETFSLLLPDGSLSEVHFTSLSEVKSGRNYSRECVTWINYYNIFRNERPVVRNVDQLFIILF